MKDDRLLNIMQYHFRWLWLLRHETAAVRRSLRDNIRGQRAVRRYNDAQD